jgi:hypothetical protein
LPKIKSVGFGYLPEQTSYFQLIKQNTFMYLHEYRHNERPIIVGAIPEFMRNQAKQEVRKHFNERLKERGYLVGKWSDDTYLESCLGKELAVLIWGIEDCSNKSEVTKVLGNWLGLSHTEHWWFYHRVQSNPSNLRDHTGWRRAVYHVLLGV